MTTKTRNFNCTQHDALAAAEQALRKVRTKSVDRSPNGFTAHVKRGFGRTFPLSVTVERNILSVSYADQSLTGDAFTILNSLTSLIDMQGAPDWLQNSALLNRVLDELYPSERIEQAAEGRSDGKLAGLLVTDQCIRLISMSLSKFSSRVIRAEDVTSVTVDSGAIFDELKLTVSNEEIEMDTIKRGTADDVVAAIRSKLQAAPVTPPVGSAIDNLETLADLHSKGILTDEEFVAAKKKVLGL